jgi:CheY-like chemotaxis protein
LRENLFKPETFLAPSVSLNDNFRQLRRRFCIAMEQSFYEFAEVLVCDPVATHRAATRSALYSLGCRHIEIVGNLRDFVQALDQRPPDVAICETQVGEAELCHLMRELRKGGQSYSPFTVIIVTAWATSPAVITEISNAGADGLLLRPFSAAMLDQRIRAHVLQRKPFVVTEDYIGPERRAAGRPSSAFSFTAPNSLKAKIDGRVNPEEASRRFAAELRAAWTKLDGETRGRPAWSPGNGAAGLHGLH